MTKRIATVLVIFAMLFTLFQPAVLAKAETTETPNEPEVSVLYGDVDGNGVVNDWDEVVLMRWLAEWEGVTINEANADVNGDGIVDDWDQIHLARYFADWDVVLGPQPSESPDPTEEPDVNAAEELWANAVEYTIAARPWASENWAGPDENGSEACRERV